MDGGGPEVIDFGRESRLGNLSGRRWLAAGVTAIVLLLALSGSGSGQRPDDAARVAAEAASVPPQVLDRVGAGDVQLISTTGPVASLAPGPDARLTADGKPELLYVGDDRCPYCASEQWVLIVALSRFGVFTGLNETSSDPEYGFGEVATLRFYGSAYVSPYLSFVPVDEQAKSGTRLQALTAGQRALMGEYEQAEHGSVPFVDVADRYTETGVLPAPDGVAAPRILQDQSWWQIAVALHDPASPVARYVDGAAGYITAAICLVTANRPAAACTPVVRALEPAVRALEPAV